jgi:hypothetical protein
VPFKADTPLVVNPNAMLAFPLSQQRLQPIRWGYLQVSQRLTVMNHTKFPESCPLNVARHLTGKLPLEYLLGLIAFEAFYHKPIILYNV